MANSETYHDIHDMHDIHETPGETHHEKPGEKAGEKHVRPGKIATLAAGGLLASSSLASPLLEQLTQSDAQAQAQAQINGQINVPPRASRPFDTDTEQPIAPFAEIFTSKAHAEEAINSATSAESVGGAGRLFSFGVDGTGTLKSVETFTDLPPGATETYKGSGLYTAPISPNMDFDIKGQEQTRYSAFGITPESAPGLPLGAIYLKDAANNKNDKNDNKYVEMALYERAAYTPFDNVPAPQILSTIIYEGKVQVSSDEFIELPQSVKSAFLKLPLAGEGDPSTPNVAQMADLMQSHAEGAVDANWQAADQSLDSQGRLTSFDIKSHFANLTSEQLAQYTLGKADAQTGHKTPDIVTQGLAKMFGEGDQIVQNAGLPKGPAVWINAKIGGKVSPVLFQQYERMALTVNPNNADSPTKVTGDMKDVKNKSVVQVGLQGQIVYNGLLAVDARPTATPTAAPKPTAEAQKTATPEAGHPEGLVSVDFPYKYGEIKIVEQSPLHFVSKSNENMAKLFNRMYEATGKSGTVNETILSMPLGNDLASLQTTAGIKDYKGLKVYQVSAGGGGFIYMTDRGADGIRYLQLGTLSPILGDNENLNRFKAGLNDPRYPLHSLSSELFLSSYLGIYGNVSFGEINGKIGPDLQPLIGYRNSQGQIDLSQVPLDLSFNQ